MHNYATITYYTLHVNVAFPVEPAQKSDFFTIPTVYCCAFGKVRPIACYQLFDVYRLTGAGSHHNIPAYTYKTWY